MRRRRQASLRRRLPQLPLSRVDGVYDGIVVCGARVIALALLLVVMLPVRAQAATTIAERVQAVHRQRRAFDGRLEGISRLFVGAPYRHSPLGEGPGVHPDPDPTMDLHHFDCLTFVEQVMALSWHGDLGRARAELQRIRYAQGVVRYGARHHIMMAQWIPHNVAAGFARDITRTVAGPRTGTAALTIRATDFDRGPAARLKLAAADRPTGRFTLPIVPIDHMPALASRIPPGTIVTTIRHPRSGVPYRASHVGLVVVVHGERRIRHAAAPAGVVVDESLVRFVARARRLRSRPVAGFNLLSIASTPPSLPAASRSQRDG